MSGGPVRRAAHLAVVERDEHVLVLDLSRLDDPRPRRFDGTALAIWRAIDGVRDRDGIVATVAEAYGVEEAGVGADIDAFLDELERLGLIDSASSSNESSDGRS
jgi:hypothetical protein